MNCSPLFNFFSHFLEQIDSSHLLSENKENGHDQNNMATKLDYFVYFINSEISVSESPKKILDSNEINSIDDIFERIEKNIYLSFETFEQDFKELYLHRIKKYDKNQVNQYFL